MIHINRCRRIPWGIQVGRWNVVWWDLWSGRPTFGISRVRSTPDETTTHIPTGTGWPS